MTKAPAKKLPAITIIFAIILVTSVLAIATIIASNTLATTGKKLQLLNQQIALLEVQNQELERTISEKKSLSSIQVRAQELGFTNINKTLNLATPEPLAQLP